MYRTRNGDGRSHGNNISYGGNTSPPTPRQGFAGGIFAEHAFSEGTIGDDALGEDFVNDVLDRSEEGVRPEHLLHHDDQEALALGRSVLGVAKAVGGLVRAVASVGRVAAGDVERGGLRGALVEGLRRAADKFDPGTRRAKPGLVENQPGNFIEDQAWPSRHWPSRAADEAYAEAHAEAAMSTPWPEEDPYTARASHDPRDPYRRFERDYVRPRRPLSTPAGIGWSHLAAAEKDIRPSTTTTVENAALGGRPPGDPEHEMLGDDLDDLYREAERDGPLVIPATGAAEEDIFREEPSETETETP